MKRIIVSSIIALLVLILAFTGYYYSQKYAVIHSNPIDAIPSDAAFFLELKNASSGIELLSKTDFFKSLCDDSSFSEIKKNLHWLDSISKNENLSTEIWTNQKLFISAHPTKASDFDFLFTCNLPRGKSANDINSIIEDLTENNYTKEEREYEAVRIHELTKNNRSQFTYAITKGVFIFSRTSFLVEDAIRQLKTGVSFNKTKTFSKVGSKLNADESILLFVNHYGMHDLLTGYIGSERNGFLIAINNICRWSRFNLKLEKNAIVFNGLNSSNDTTDLFSAIHNQSSAISHSSAVAPSRTAFLFDVCVSNIDQYLNCLRSNERFFIPKATAQKLIDSLDRKHKFNLRKLMTGWNTKEIALAITEPGSVNLESNTYALIRSNNTTEAIESLNKIQKVTGKIGGIEKYRSHTISNFNLNAAVPLFYGNIFIDIQQSYFTAIKDFIVFANSPSILKSLIDDFEEKRILEKEQDYISHLNNSILTSQINIYFNLQRGTNILRSLTNEEISPKLINNGIFKKSVQSIALSFATKKDMTISTGRIDFSGKFSKEIHLLWSSQLDTTPCTPPFVIVNGENKYIAIQDDNLNLNLYSESGKLIWKKYLGERILSKIFFMDQYNNGQCQLVFNTIGKLYLLSVNGDSISNFPIRLPASATNGCLVKDFDGYNKFEIYIACANGTIYAYENSGKPLSQWMFKQSVYGITKNFMPIRYNNTDFIYAEGNQGQYIIDRKGKTVKIKSPENSIKKTIVAYMDSGKSCTLFILDNSGKLFSSDPAKTGELTSLNLTDSISDIASFGNQLTDNIVFLSQNKLYTYSESDKSHLINEFNTDKNLQFVNQLNFTERAGLTDKTHNKFYLLSTSATIEEGFPVWGSSDFCLMKSDDNASDSYIVIVDSNGVIYVYNE